MKNIILTSIALLFCTVSFAQKDVTKFMGIPVDGFKPAMIQKLKAKGFTESPLQKGVLEGEFNGVEVNVHIATNNNKVYRIMVCDKNTRSAGEIRIRFNQLVSQFMKNERYTSASLESFEIPEDEDVHYNIAIKDKRYEAVFFQLSNQVDTLAIQQYVLEKMRSKFTSEQLENPTEEVRKEWFSTAIMAQLEMNSKRPVWFIISKYRYDEYYITMFYDNEYNHADGEDL